MIAKSIRRLRSNEEGVSAIEFAFVVMILVVLVMGIIEFGWILRGHITLTGAAREGVRAAIVGGGHVEAAESHMGTFKDQLNSYSITIETGEVAIGEEMTVRVSGNIDLLTRFFDWLGTGGNYDLSAVATMRYVGESAGGLPPGSGSETDPDPDPEPDPEPDPDPDPDPDPTPPVPTGETNGNHLDVSNILNNATVYLYDSNGDLIGTQTTNHNQTSVRFNNAARNYEGQTLYFQQVVTIDGVEFTSDAGYITIPG